MAVAKIIKVYSHSDSVSHQPDTGELYWSWERNPYEDECYLELDRKTFEDELRRKVGFRKMFERGTLAIKESSVLEAFRLKDVEEYVMDKTQLTALIFDGTIDKLEDFLQYAPQTMLDNMETICTKTELMDRKKLKLIKEYTGKDIEEFYHDKDELNEEITEEDKVEKKGKQPRKKIS